MAFILATCVLATFVMVILILVAFVLLREGLKKNWLLAEPHLTPPLPTNLGLVIR